LHPPEQSQCPINGDEGRKIRISWLSGTFIKYLFGNLNKKEKSS